jgi:hypothetical protein
MLVVSLCFEVIKFLHGLSGWCTCDVQAIQSSVVCFSVCWIPISCCLIFIGVKNL